MIFKRNVPRGAFNIPGRPFESFHRALNPDRRRANAFPIKVKEKKKEEKIAKHYLCM